MLSEPSSCVVEAARVESFRYPAISLPATGEAMALSPSGPFKAQEASFQRQLASAVEEAQRRGFRDGQLQGAREAAEKLDQQRSALVAALKGFADERTRYFRSVETEVVRLALAIARRILHREAQVDPLLLAGVARVALDQIEAGTRVLLRTSPGCAGAWTEFCSQQVEAVHPVEVVADPSLEGPGCILQTETGSIEINLDAQLQEIEAGFFDLLETKNASGDR